MSKSPFFAEAMAEGIASNAKIARAIKPEVEKYLFEEVSESSIAMALHRLGKDDIARPVFGMRFLKKMSDITARSNLVALASPDAAELSELLTHALRAARQRKSAFVNFARGLYESLLIVDGETAGAIANACKVESTVRRTEQLSAITLRLPEESLAVPGVYYPILKALALEGISLVEVVSVRTEFSIIFYDKDVDRAFSILKRITT